MKTIACIICWCLSVCQSSYAQTYAIGADLSFMKQAEDDGFSFKEDGQTKPCLQIFKDHGYNWIRLRLFHTPTRLPNNLEYTIALARDAKNMGFRFLLDYHYSDTWADPGKQFIPKAWEEKSHGELVQAGINGVYASCGNNPCPEIMIHIDKGGDKNFTEYFFDFPFLIKHDRNVLQE